MMILFSGIRPTAHIHLGNYLGAIRQWIDLTQKTETSAYFCIVNQHALTTLDTLQSLYEDTLHAAATYMACGLDPEKQVIFIQSDIPFHTELAWYLACMTPMGWLNRMTQFKDKSRSKASDQIGLGLYAYPTLMAADILLYKTTHVPVGEDQKQHVEFTRDLAQRFQEHIGSQVFTIPEPVIHQQTARIMSLRDGTIKMSKSDPSELSRIHLTDSDDMIQRKIQKAKTDPLPLPQTQDDMKTRPEAKNLLSLYATLSERSLDETINQFSGKLFSQLKHELTDVLIHHLAPIRTSIRRFMQDKSYLRDSLEKGKVKAFSQAEQTIKSIRHALQVEK